MTAIDSRLLRAFSPGCVAIVGASEDRNKVGGRPLYYLKHLGYQGTVYPINPKREFIQGAPALATLADTPIKPDVCVVAVGEEQVLSTIAQCGARGIGAAVVLSSGFGEAGPQGVLRQQALLECARKYGVRLVGPNAQGIANFRTGAVLNFSTMFMETEALDGPVAIISQSGAASVMPYALLRERGIGVRYVVASGNDADASVAELALVAAADPEIRVVLLYIESLTDATVLAEVARTANARGAAVVALKAGRSDEGAKAAASHTGAIVNDDVSVDAFLERHGIWRAQDVHGLVNAVDLYLSCGMRAAERLIVLSNSGAVGVLAADGAARFKIRLAALAPSTTDKLREIIPSFAAAQNPMDLTAALMSDSSLFSRSLSALAGDPQAGMFLVGVPVAGEGYDIAGMAATVASLARSDGRPAVVFAPQAKVREAFRAQGVPAFANETDALSALSQVTRHARLQAEALERDQLAPTHEAGLSETPRASEEGVAIGLNEARSLQLIEEAGIPVVPHRLCTTLDEALRARGDLGPAVVVKACCAAIPHKSEHGLVFLTCSTAEDVGQAWEACVRRVRDMGHAPDGVIVASKVHGTREFALGVRQDPLFGTMVMVGDGGKYVEALRDFAVLLYPFDRQQVLDKLQLLRVAPLFEGLRGDTPVDLESVADAVVRLGAYAARRRDAIRSIDLNPLIAGARGAGVWAVDAVVEVAANTVQPITDDASVVQIR
ncbi:CoA-binding domain protein [Delftia sp. Cs1-4]|uniref:acetate--CoA ligase family protein n=1 Tax=Delftia sp. (strain Cs1-4) TaxID=742013 RepID=UPI00020E7AE7|nr:acetate--CoA ligase family protein [Delftia sp. Cs1-4]AEF88757.1 CoA-binding domain protein [Delftia sp. Cs1-4]